MGKSGRALIILTLASLLLSLVAATVGLTKPEAAKAESTTGVCPPAYLEVTSTTLDASVGKSVQQVNIRWAKPTAARQAQCTAAAPDFPNNLDWIMNLYHTNPGQSEQHENWDMGYSTLAQNYNELAWGSTYRAILTLRHTDQNDQSVKDIGSIEVDGTTLKGPGAAAGQASGKDCDVKKLTGAVERFYKSPADTTNWAIHFSYTGAGCSYDSIKVIRPDKKVASGTAVLGNEQDTDYKWRDDTPQKGVYTFQSIKGNTTSTAEIVDGSVTIDIEDANINPPGSLTYSKDGGASSATGSTPDVSLNPQGEGVDCGNEGWWTNITDPIGRAVRGMYCLVLTGLWDAIKFFADSVLNVAAGLSYNVTPANKTNWLAAVGIEKARAQSTTVNGAGSGAGVGSGTSPPTSQTIALSSSATNNQLDNELQTLDSQIAPSSSGTSPPKSTSTTGSTSSPAKSTVGTQSTFTPQGGTGPAPTGAITNSLSVQLSPYSDADHQEKFVIDAWKALRTFIDAFLIFALIFIAFSNIFQISIDTYVVKKSLPGLILGVVLANFSLLICVGLLDVSQILTSWLANGSTVNLANQLVQCFNIDKFFGDGGLLASYGLVTSGLGVLGFLVGFIVLLAILIGIVILSFLLYIRIGIIYLLVGVSPLAFLAMGLPVTSGLFKKWWDQMLRWTFMLPLTFFVIRIAVAFGGNDQVSILKYAIVIGLLYASSLVPLKFGGALGGAVMGLWAGQIGKGLGRSTANAAAGYADKYTGGRTPWTLYKGWRKKGEEDITKIRAIGEGRGMNLHTRWGSMGKEKGPYLQKAMEQQVAEERKKYNYYDREQRLARAAELDGRNDLAAKIEKRALMNDLHENNDGNELLKAAADAHDNSDFETRDRLLKFMGYEAGNEGFKKFEDETSHTASAVKDENDDWINSGINGPEAVKAVLTHMFGGQVVLHDTDENGNVMGHDNNGERVYRQEIVGPSEMALQTMGEISFNAKKNMMFHLSDLVSYEGGKLKITGAKEQLDKALDSASKVDPQGLARNSVHHVWQAERLHKNAQGTTYIDDNPTAFAGLGVQEAPKNFEALLSQYVRARGRSKQAIEKNIVKLLKMEEHSFQGRDQEQVLRNFLEGSSSTSKTVQESLFRNPNLVTRIESETPIRFPQQQPQQQQPAGGGGGAAGNRRGGRRRRRGGP